MGAQSIFISHQIYPILPYMLEAAVVGWCVRRGFLALVADAAYWCLAGVPLVIAIHRMGVSFQQEPLWPTLIGYAPSGILGVTVADLFTGSPLLRRWFTSPPYPAQSLRIHLSRGLMLATTVPFLAVNVVLDSVHTLRYQAAAGIRLEDTLARVVGDTNKFHRQAPGCFC